jgi:hypothetical protein
MPLPVREKSSGSNFLSLQDGENRIRIVSMPQDFWIHFDNETKKSFKCQGRKTCQLCKSDNERLKKASHKFMFAAFSRDEQKQLSAECKDTKAVVKLLEVGGTVYDAIQAISANEDYSFDTIPPCDFIITKRGKGMETSYSVFPCPPKPISENDLAGIAEGKTLEELLSDKFGKGAEAPIEVTQEESDRGRMKNEEEIDLAEINF